MGFPDGSEGKNSICNAGDTKTKYPYCDRACDPIMMIRNLQNLHLFSMYWIVDHYRDSRDYVCKASEGRSPSQRKLDIEKMFEELHDGIYNLRKQLT